MTTTLITAYVLCALSYGFALAAVKGYRGLELIAVFFMACTWPFWLLFRVFVVLLIAL